MARIRSMALIAALALLAACSNGGSDLSLGGGTPSPSPGATPRAKCGPGSRPETGIQGRVSKAEHDSGRAAEGYDCNMEVVSSYATANAIGTVGGFKVERYTDAAGHDCAYYDTTLLFPTNIFDLEAGVNVLDMSDPTQPKLTAQLITPAMLTPHESLVVSKERGVLAAVTGNPAFYPGVVDVYDISQDCRHPVLKASLPVGLLGHESGMAPDGKTFYSSSPGTPTLTAVDISNLSLPLPLVVTDYNSHGLSISDDGNRAYLAFTGEPASGLVILDVSEVQARKPNPQVREVGRVTWDNVTIPQNAIPFTVKGHPYVLEIDEYSTDEGLSTAANGTRVGAGRIIDIGDETKPRVISDLRLEVHEPENRAALAGDPGAGNPTQGYAGHYCNLPTRVDPKIVACSMIVSGLRVFDISDVHHPREVAYFIAPAPGRPIPLPIFDGGNWAMSSPSFVPERKEIWYSDGYSGFYVLRVTNGAWP